MKTPYDTALRLIQREVDGMRVTIGEAAGSLSQLEQARQAAAGAIEREAALAARRWDLPTGSYLARMRAKREGLKLEAASVADRLDALRRSATERYGVLRAIESAAAAHRDGVTQEENRASDAGMDDRTGARLALALRLRQWERRDGR